MFASLRHLLLLLLMVFTASGGAANADEIQRPGFLKGTVWEAKQPHKRMSVGPQGQIVTAKGQRLYVEFLDFVEGVYAVKVHWWSVEDNLNVVEYGVMVHEIETTYAYIEADHPADSTFPGISGSGFFRVIDGESGNRAEFSQMGRMLNGHASAFINVLERVKRAPDVPVKQTYPTVE